ncbi:MAG: hypothetical protein J6X28_01145 [Bacilli bacterium]|nr:hypothetical protein [Bacilli bacterium]
MKKSEVEKMFAEDTKRKKSILTYLGMIILFVGFSCLFFYTYNALNQTKYVNYTENSDVDYKVYLKDNTFYENEFIEKDEQYISDLIDYITATFHYKLTLEKPATTYRYTYRVEANVVVKDKTTFKNLYNYDDVLITKVDKVTDETTTEITEQVNINYNKYNDLIKDFIRTYDIDNVTSTLTVNLYVDILNNCNDKSAATGNESVTSLVIPLTNKTMGMDITNSIIDNEGNSILCSEPSKANILFLLSSIVSLFIAGILVVRTVIFMETTKTAKSIYERELKKILGNYGAYIQRVNGTFDLSGYKSLRIDSFTDMLEIRDTINQPILMIENAKKTGVYFIIPSTNKILYTYGIKVVDIQRDLEKKEKEEENHL